MREIPLKHEMPGFWLLLLRGHAGLLNDVFKDLQVFESVADEENSLGRKEVLQESQRPVFTLGIVFISLKEGLDWTTPAGRLQAQLLAMISEFERSRIAERVRLGMARARTQGKHVGRPSNTVTDADLAACADLSVRQAASRLGVSKSFIAARRRQLSTRVA